MTGQKTLELAQALRVSYAYHYGETGLIPWEDADPKKQAAWIACAEGAADLLGDPAEIQRLRQRRMLQAERIWGLQEENKHLREKLENGAGLTTNQLREKLEAAWTDFLDSNPDGLTSPEDLPDHALVTCDQMIGMVEAALAGDEA